jgi:hypothetical protein
MKLLLGQFFVDNQGRNPGELRDNFFVFIHENYQHYSNIA